MDAKALDVVILSDKDMKILTELNSGKARIEPYPLKDGRWFVKASLVNDLAYKQYKKFLSGREVISITVKDIANGKDEKPKHVLKRDERLKSIVVTKKEVDNLR